MAHYGKPEPPGREIDKEPTTISPPHARHIEAPETYLSGDPPDDFMDFKEDFDEGQWVGTGITCVLPGGGNNPKKYRR